MIKNLPGQSTRNYRKYILNVFGIFVIVLLIWYLYNNRDTLDALRNIRWQQILWIILLDTASFLVNSLLNQLLINRFNPTIGFLDNLLLQYANNFLNKILPTIGGGATFRAVYLKRKYQFPYSQFVSIIGGLYVISFLSVAGVGLICLLIIYARYHQSNLVILMAFIFIVVACLTVILFSPRIPASTNKILKALKSIIDGWQTIKKDLRFIFVYIAFSTLLLFLSALQTLISYQALGVQPNLVSTLFLATLGIIIALLSFTPDGIGVKEGIYIFSANLAQLPDGILVLGSLILRAISFCTTLIVGGISYWLLMKELGKLEAGINNGTG